MPDTITQTIQKFYSVAQERGFSRDIHFRVLSIDLGDGSPVKFDDDDIVYIRAAQLPGRTIANQTVPFMGLQFNIPGTASYPSSENYNVTFLADAKSIIRDKLEKASRAIFDDATSTGNYFTPKANATMDLVQIDSQMNVIKHYTLVGVSIRNVNAMDYKVDGNGATVQISCTLAYHYYEVK